MSPWRDMAADAGYPHGTDANHQMAALIEEAEQAEMLRYQANEYGCEMQPIQCQICGELVPYCDAGQAAGLVVCSEICEMIAAHVFGCDA